MNRRQWMWRLWVGGICISLAPVINPALLYAQDANNPSAQNQQVDPAAKKLIAANGLYSRGLFKLAASEYSEFLQQYPSHAQATAARYALAVCQYRLQDFAKGAEELRKVLADSKFEQRDEALAVLGHCELSQGHYDPALAAFDELLEKYPSSKHAELATLNRAQTLYLAKRYADAAKACRDYLDKYNQSAARPDALYFLALSQRAQNQNDAAVETLAELTGKYPESPHQVDAWLLTGQALEAEGKLDQAIVAYGKMLGAAPDARKPDALYSLGVALYKAGKYDTAAGAFSTLIKGFANSPYASASLLQLGLSELGAGQISQARETLNLVSGQDPKRASEARYGLAQCDIAEKNYKQARQTLEELMSLNPTPANITQIALDRAVCTMELKEYQPAADQLQDLRTRYPDAPQTAEATYRQAFCLYKIGKYDQSHELCQQAARMKLGSLAAANDELDAEDLFLLSKYSDAKKQFVVLCQSTKDPARKLRFIFRQGQCEYLQGNYPAAVEVLGPIASESKTQQDPELRATNLLLGDALLQQGKYSDAIDPLKRYLESADSDRPQARYKLATAELHANQTDAARQEFEHATDGPADSPWVQRAWFERGQLDLKDKKLDQAAEAFRRAISNGAAADIAAPAQYQLGWAEFQSHRFPEAAAAWKEMAEKYPKDKLAADAQFQQGVALREAKQFDQAAQVLQAFAAAHPDAQNAVRARQLAAESLKDLGKNDEARQMLSGLAEQAKGAGTDSIFYDLAWTQRDAKDTAAAESSYRRLLGEHPDSKLAPAARTELAELLYNDKKFQEAAGLLEQVVSEKSVDPKILSVANYRLGWCYEELKDPQKAAAVFAAYTQKGGGTDEMNASALVQAGLAFAQDQKFDKAEQALSQMLQKYPNQKDASVAMLKLGEVQAEQNEFEPSQRTYRDFLDKYASSEFAYRAHFGIGWALENQKKYDEARQEYQKTITSTNGPTAARAQFQIGETYLAEGKFEQAIPALLAVDDVYKYPQWSARAVFEAGRAFEQLKQNDRARKQYTEVINKYKDAPEADMARERLKNLPGS